MKHLVKKIILLSLTAILFLYSCADIQMLNKKDYYSSAFLKRMESIQIIYKDGDKQLAMQKLQRIPDETITKAEKAKKYNFLGVMYFSRGNLGSAIENFQKAKEFVSGDYYLSSQIHLNLASSYYKGSNLELSRSIMKAVNLDTFNDKEKVKFYKLNLNVANELDDSKEIVNSLIFLMKDIKRFSEVEDYQYKELLIDKYRKLTSSERVFFLDKYQGNREVVIAYLGKQEVLQRFYQGDKSGAQDVIEWLEGRFLQLEEVARFVEDYKYRVDNFSKINSGAVGVLVPLSKSSKSKYGKKVIAGVTTALNALQKDDQTLNIYIKDNKNNKFLARKMVQELVMKHHVSIIIGGLFPDLAKEEFLEAKKYGVLYISLSQVYLPREEKNHLLIEMQGSVESQINTVLSPKSLEYFGKKMAILYPWSDGGKSYMNEFWGFKNSGKIELTGINHYYPAKRRSSKYIDYREPVKQLLSLKYPRERKEELLVWKEIRNLDKRKFRIINEMPPVVDFDWVFVPSLPKEAIQILPTFPYFDAKGLKFVGGPSWINKKLKLEQSSLGKMYVIGNDIKELGVNFQKSYRAYNNVNPTLVDTISYDSMVIAKSILDNQTFKKRDELENRLLGLDKISGMTSSWTLINGLWLKKMDILKISKKGFTKLEMN